MLSLSAREQDAPTIVVHCLHVPPRRAVCRDTDDAPHVREAAPHVMVLVEDEPDAGHQDPLEPTLQDRRHRAPPGRIHEDERLGLLDDLGMAFGHRVEDRPIAVVRQPLGLCSWLPGNLRRRGRAPSPRGRLSTARAWPSDAIAWVEAVRVRMWRRRPQLACWANASGALYDPHVMESEGPRHVPVGIYLVSFVVLGSALSMAGPALSHLRDRVGTDDGGISLVFVGIVERIHVGFVPRRPLARPWPRAPDVGDMHGRFGRFQSS